MRVHSHNPIWVETVVIPKSLPFLTVREQSNANVLPLLPPVRGLYQIRYTYDKDHTHLLEMLQYLLYTVRYDRMYLDHLENNDKGNR